MSIAEMAAVRSPTGPEAAQAPVLLQRRLARWNRRRLAPARPGANWRAELDEEHEMRRLEGGFVQASIAEVAAEAAEAPADPQGFIAWFEALKSDGPGQGDPLFEWLAEAAGLQPMRWFLRQEAVGEAGFDDLVAMTQVKFPSRPKLELARNYWDEMGRGSEAGMHGLMLEHTGAGLDLQPSIEDTVEPALALANTMTALATTRRYAFHSVGALGAVELTSPTRVDKVARGLKRLGVEPRVRKYFDLHALLDVKHSQDWNREVVAPLVAADPACARALAEGALMRLRCGERCFQAYRAELWGRA